MRRTNHARLFLFLSLAANGFLGVIILPSLIANAPAEQSQTLDNPDVIVRTLRDGQDSEKERLADLLNLKTPKESVIGATRDIPCRSYDTVRVDTVVLEVLGPQTVVQAQSLACWLTFIIVLEQEPSTQRWVWDTTVRIGSQHTTPSIRFESLLNASDKEIIVHGNEVAAGTGIFQSNFTIYKFLNRRLNVIFDEAEKVVLAVGTERSGRLDNTYQEQKSTFTFLDDRRRISGLKEIHEKQIIRDHKTTIRRWRVFNWDHETKRFQSMPAER